MVHTHNAGLLFQKVLERMDAQAKLVPPAAGSAPHGEERPTIIDITPDLVSPELAQDSDGDATPVRHGSQATDDAE